MREIRARKIFCSKYHPDHQDTTRYFLGNSRYRPVFTSVVCTVLLPVRDRFAH